ncbi:zinc-binding dehydrogenase [Phytoactinopolyspora alkaliphila]|uniref:Zinc-binding dehydrogenase n=1 Tax=Phytoactinopolyspora alkaliphila TaxID=1783498 RepID=A0A6N9YI56_9ACTN|nr:zinc-binding dehydrogenase [Phytoactinopolyspora alkaliphila]NED94683.1 zinc-binding dehydrogenase [Phytoactinopolyspora alkaliphila]
MPQIVQFTEPGRAELVACEAQPLTTGCVRVRTRYSGISAGTELTAFRGTNPYLTKSWDTERRIFVDGPPTFPYPVMGWGYSEVGEVVEVADDVEDVSVGTTIYGAWGHRSDAVIPANRVAGQVLPAGIDVLDGVFARVGAIALNAVLAAAPCLGETVAVFGQGVIGLLATRLVTLSGADAIAIDPVDRRRDLAVQFGAQATLSADSPAGAGAAVRDLTGGPGADSAIELSGSYRALHEAVRAVSPDSRVVAAGFYQGEAGGLRLGEEFHHNRVQIVASQIGATPVSLGARWTPQRLGTVFLSRIARGDLDTKPLVSDVLPAAAVADAFALLDRGAEQTLQVVLDFGDPR